MPCGSWENTAKARQVSKCGKSRDSILTVTEIKRAIFEIRKVLGEIPILASEQVSNSTFTLAYSVVALGPGRGCGRVEYFGK